MSLLTLANLFTPIVLNSEEGWADVLVFGIGPVDDDRVDEVLRWADQEADERIEDYAEEGWTHLKEETHVDRGPFLNDRYQANLVDYNWCVCPSNDLWPEWDVDEENINELRKPARSGRASYCPECGAEPGQRCDVPNRYCTTDELADDWQARVNADPDRWPNAPLGPFPGVMVTIRIRSRRSEPVGEGAGS